MLSLHPGIGEGRLSEEETQASLARDTGQFSLINGHPPSRQAIAEK